MRYGPAFIAVCLISAWSLLPAGCASPPPAEPGPEGVGGPPVAAEVRIEGNREISTGALERAAGDALLLLAREGRRWEGDDAAYAMEEYCREEGYYAARVEYDYEPGPPVRVRFRVTEGPRAVIDELSLLGRGEVSRKELTPFFAGPTTGIMGGERIFVARRVEEGAALVRDYYRSLGYLRVKVKGPEVTFYDRGRKAKVTLEIHPGPKFVLREVRVEGAEIPREDLLQALDAPLGRPYTRYWPVAATRKVRAWLRSRGRALAEVKAVPEMDRENGAVTVIFKVRPGPVYTVRRVVLRGVDRTALSFVRSVFGVQEGARFDGGRVESGVSALYDTGLFDRVDVREIPSGEDAIDLEVDLREREARSVGFLAGYGAYELLRGAVTYADRNLFGRGLAWSSTVKLSFRGVRTETSLTDPRFLGLPLSGTVEIYGEQHRYPSFTSAQYGGVASLSKGFGPYVDGTVGYAYERSVAEDVDPGVEALNLDQRATLGSLFTRWAVDSRDSKVLPRRGGIHEIMFQAAEGLLGSEVDFNKVTARSAWFLPLEERARWVLALGARAGVIVRNHGTDLVPIQYRFFNGGADSVRSFKEHELGPKVQGDPVGGEFFSTVNAELRTPLYERLSGALFADGGNVLLRRTEAGFRDYRYALGLGLRYALPIGPVRLDWGWNPDRRKDEDPWALHLSVGFAF